MLALPDEVLDRISVLGVSFEMSRVCVAWRRATRRRFARGAALPDDIVSSLDCSDLLVLRLGREVMTLVPPDQAFPVLRFLSVAVSGFGLPAMPSLLKLVLKGEHLQALPNTPQLRVLDLKICDVSFFPKYPRLRELRLDDLGYLREIPNSVLLEHIHLTNMPHLTGDLPSTLPRLRTLSAVWCNSMSISASAEYPILHTLIMKRCNSITNICRLPSLQALTIERCDRLLEVPSIEQLL